MLHLRTFGALVLSAALVVSAGSLEGVGAAPASPKSFGHRADGADRGKPKPKQKLTLVSTTPAPIVTGSTVSFTGTAPSKVNGAAVKLFRSVGAGDWIQVGKGRVSGGGFSVSGLATGQEANSWMVVAKVKKGRKRHKRKKTYISGVVSQTVFSWYPMTSSNAVSEYNDFYDGTVEIGAETFIKAMFARTDYDETDYGEWNLSYKCVQVTAAYGLDNDSPTGSNAQFFAELDGTPVPLLAKGLGPATRASIDVNSRLRIKLGITGLSYGEQLPAFGAPQALCSASPF